MDAPGKVPATIACHSCGAIQDLTGQTGFTHAECFRCGALIVVPLEFGSFLLLNAMGIGGMGTVYKAVDMSLNRPVALKILRKKLASNSDFIESFSREARAAAAVNHPNIAQVYSFAEQDGQYYLAMELLERGSLDDRITKLGKVPEKELLQIGVQIASGLRAAQQRGLLHRDIKPGNILFNDQGVPKIVDFGLARAQAAQKDETDASSQASGEPIWGTPYYIAPEKLRGLPEDFRSDMYSLGATMFHSLAGRPPFEADTVGEVVTKHATQPALSLKTYAPTTHDVTAHVIARMLAKSPAERYESYDDLIHELNEALNQIKASDAAPAIVAASGERISLLSIVGSVAGAILCVLLVVYVWMKFLRPQFAAGPSPTPTTAGPAGAAPGTNASAVATAGTTAVDKVDFSEDAPWTKTWDTATLQLAQGHYQDALSAYATALTQVGPVRSRHRQWIQYYQGLTLVAADRPGEASQSFRWGISPRQLEPDVRHEIPQEVTTGNFVGVLQLAMLGNIALSELEAAIPRMQPWAAAQTRLAMGFKEMADGQFGKAAESFRAYQKMPRDEKQRWAFNLQLLAQNFSRDCDAAARTLAEIDELEKKEQIKEAVDKLTEAISATKLTALKAALLSRKTSLQSALDKQTEQLKAAQEQAERDRQAHEEQERARAQVEAKLLQSIEPDLTRFWPAYDFTNALARFETVAPKFESTDGRRTLEQRTTTAKLLIEFKNLLAADFVRRPYDGATLQRRDATRLSGKLVRATDTDLVFATPYGEVLTKWGELAPGTLRAMAESYMTAFAATEKPEVQARRYLALAVFCKQYGLDRWVLGYSQQATRLSPALQQQVELIFGKASS